MTQKNRISVTVDLTDEQAEGLAEFFKRACFSDYRAQAKNEQEAYAMRDGAQALREALANIGYEPR